MEASALQIWISIRELWKQKSQRFLFSQILVAYTFLRVQYSWTIAVDLMGYTRAGVLFIDRIAVHCLSNLSWLAHKLPSVFNGTLMHKPRNDPIKRFPPYQLQCVQEWTLTSELCTLPNPLGWGLLLMVLPYSLKYTNIVWSAFDDATITQKCDIFFQEE